MTCKAERVNNNYDTYTNPHDCYRDQYDRLTNQYGCRIAGPGPRSGPRSGLQQAYSVQCLPLVAPNHEEAPVF